MSELIEVSEQSIAGKKKPAPVLRERRGAGLRGADWRLQPGPLGPRRPCRCGSQARYRTPSQDLRDRAGAADPGTRLLLLRGVPQGLCATRRWGSSAPRCRPPRCAWGSAAALVSFAEERPAGRTGRRVGQAGRASGRPSRPPSARERSSPSRPASLGLDGTGSVGLGLDRRDGRAARCARLGQTRAPSATPIRTRRPSPGVCGARPSGAASPTPPGAWCWETAQPGSGT